MSTTQVAIAPGGQRLVKKAIRWNISMFRYRGLLLSDLRRRTSNETMQNKPETDECFGAFVLLANGNKMDRSFGDPVGLRCWELAVRCTLNLKTPLGVKHRRCDISV